MALPELMRAWWSRAVQLLVITCAIAAPVSICFLHPPIHSQLVETNGAAYTFPASHPSVQQLFSGFADFVDEHSNVDARLRAGEKYEVPPEHPNIETATYIVRRAATDTAGCFPTPAPGECGTNVSRRHTDIDAAIANAGLAYPANHPKVQTLLAKFIPASHRDVDAIMAEKTPLPTGHPNIEQYVCRVNRTYTLPPKGTCPFNISKSHINITEAITNSTVSYPANHAKVQVLLADWIPSWHRDVDSLMTDKTPLPSNHPDMEAYVCRVDRTYAAPPNGSCPAYIGPSHPNVTRSINNASFAYPNGHPSATTLLGSWVPSWHRDIDILMRDKVPLSLGHPSVEQFICVGYNPVSKDTCPVKVGRNHPSVDKAFALSTKLPASHPSVDKIMSQWIPFGHPNVDSLIEDGRAALPAGHPSIDDFICLPGIFSSGVVASTAAASAFGLAVLIRWCYKLQKCWMQRSLVEKVNIASGAAAGAAIVGTRLADRKKDTLDMDRGAALEMQEIGIGGTIRTTSHESLGGGGGARAKAGTSRAQSRHHCRAKSDYRMPPKCSHDADPEPRRNGPSEAKKRRSIAPALPPRPKPSPLYTTQQNRPPPPPPLPRRNRELRRMQTLHAQHKKRDLFDADEKYERARLPSQGRVHLRLTNKDRLLEAKSQGFWARLRFILFHYRVWDDWNSGHVLAFGVYFGLMMLCLYTSSDQDSGRAWGSLAAFNTMILVVPATRNSVCTWLLGLPFDHVVIYHRFLGRVALLCTLFHFSYFADNLKKSYQEAAYATGLGAMSCGIVIGLSSINYIRRKHFNVFYWSHYAFVGYYGLAWVHVPQTQPFLSVGIALYGLDKMLRAVWTGWPMKTTVFRNKNEQICQVRFNKNAITQWLGMHRVGQYYFVNFPALSLTEWHPFSVSSGPREDGVELHIRALGDHTREIVALATKRAKQVTKNRAYIRVDGPYGLHDFNCRRYPALLLVGGGVGITPVIGILKDIYLVGSYAPSERSRSLPHRIESVYAVWVMRQETDYSCFRQELDACLAAAKSSEQFPALVIWVYVSRAKREDLPFPLIKGRPQFKPMFEEIHDRHPDKAALVFACGPGAMINQLWDQCIQMTVTGARYDFHHETFEF